ncbi:glycosyl hydrolase family 18 protein [Mangrovivirga sp. M17]|uniref:chitinase n=1 Tax=Mangrovivirga halotolerans TaxID=2993936 RepID=A0ABT3RMV7_9BACT|nr:glycosyl hydrolase family 18 protein [Mangrovivirga halotolerans]MCX2742704.1 glycosyl hydrolase family 18 protein [Mangrovivirga halotolerans]
MLSKICYVLFGLVCFLLTENISAQDGLKDKFNQVIRENSIEEKTPQKPQEETQKEDQTSAKRDSIEVVKKKAESQDSLMTAMEDLSFDAGGIQKDAIDSLKFESRVLSVKRRRPEKEYSREAQWSKYMGVTHNNVYKKEHVLDTTKNVLGWHPYWMGDAYKSYNFSLLSVIAYFSYELNPGTGGYKTVHDWKTTALVDSAKANGTKVVLSVTNFGAQNNLKFLSNKKAQKNFIDQLIDLLRLRGAHGVNIDFENIPRASREQFTNFIIDLSSSLRSIDKDYLITIAVPPIDFNRVFEIRQLTPHVDLFVIMGYEYYGANSSVAGPVAPLQSGQLWWEYNLQSAVNEYLVAGTPARKLLLGLPYYGSEWMTYDLKFPSKARKYIGTTTYRNIRKKHGDLACCEDDVSKSKFYVYRDNSNNYRQLWYDDSLSLSRKYDYINEQNLGGVGIWALGYDNGYTELWKLLAAKFALSESKAAAVKASVSSSRFSFRRIMSLAYRIMRNPQRLFSNPRPLIGVFGALFGVSIFGFYALYRWGCRFKRMFGIAIKSTLALLIIILLAVIFIAMKYTAVRDIAFLLSGFIVGSIIILFISRKFLTEKDLP